ncbi:probable serine/threonine-protein kinase ndrD isoform X1 [Lucilia cuprina]|uniref:probable serine/threonine-protein kinase ndrD isoform X1 n=1 Tax=Lucilia cuprina TaxID=7375 RepID=UPI001F051928|nr:probable serine/threonine-protein kinase ndrD isoform X1 [Lucilia cuprina]
MNHMESEETSNDDTNIISDLLNSAEAMQSASSSAIITKVQVPLKNNENTSEISTAIVCDANNKLNMLSTMQQSNSLVISGGGGNNSGLLNSTQYSDTGDLNKIHVRHVHIPYILNGELYQIQTQDGENVTVKCCHCPPDRVYRGSVRSTGNFHMHIKRRHPDLLEKLHDMKVNALLERRDRLMRNRKITHRNNRNRTNTNIGCSFKHEAKSEMITPTPGSQITLDTTSDLSLLHTHKLKIKTVFQRHQMQQREAAEMQNWNKTDYVVMPIGNLTTNDESEQPINYSLKISNNQESLSNNNQQEMLHEKTINNFTNIANQATNNMQQNEYICENHVSTSSISCPSVVSSYSSNHHYEMEINRPYTSLPFHHHNLSIIKPEHFPLMNETEAIDLTTHTDSGIFSNSEDSIEQNDSHNDSINNNRAGSQKTNTDNINVERNNGDNINNTNNNNNSAKWQELLMQVENSLRDIQREMNVRNQIESNRMFLDIAKFKYLNPGFQFNW